MAIPIASASSGDALRPNFAATHSFAARFQSTRPTSVSDAPFLGMERATTATPETRRHV